MIKFIQNTLTKVLRTLIIDDEAHIRESLAEMLKMDCPGTRLVAQADGVRTGIDAIHQHQPDLVLLDIRMKDGTGFDLLQQFDNIDFRIIFITAYDEYAIKAIKFSALDYILKPVDPEDLKNAVDKAEEINQKELNAKLDNLSDNLKTSDQDKKKIILKTMDNIYLVGVKDIIHIEGEGRYSTLCLDSGEKVMVSVNLKYYQEMLEEYGFFRAHKSHLINLDHIYRFEKADGGYVVLNNNSKIPVASRKKDELIELFEKLTS
jgi:two-component system LytT family response regulator